MKRFAVLTQLNIWLSSRAVSELRPRYGRDVVGDLDSVRTAADQPALRRLVRMRLHECLEVPCVSG